MCVGTGLERLLTYGSFSLFREREGVIGVTVVLGPLFQRERSTSVAYGHDVLGLRFWMIPCSDEGSSP
jgi:hypothetical protein